MSDMQTIDLREDGETMEEQRNLLAGLEAITSARSLSTWSDDHDLQALMLQHEQSSWAVGQRLLRRVDVA